MKSKALNLLRNLLLGLLLTGSLVIAFNKVYSWYKIDRHKAKVELVVKFDNVMCKEKSHPLFIGVINNSNKTITKTTTYIELT